jgi:penicillin-binding protein 2
MRNDSFQSKLFTRRALTLTGMKLSLLLSLVARLYYLQVIKVREYKTLSDSNRIRLSVIPPLRGTIYDRFGMETATNQNYYRVLFDPGQGAKMNDTLARLSNILGFTYEEQQAFIAKAKAKRKEQRGPILLYDYLTWQQLARIEVNIPDLPGVSIDVAQVRHYPYGEELAHPLGYVDNVSQEDAKDTRNPLLLHPDFKIGKNAIERSFEASLRGKAGVKQLEVNAFGLAVRELSREESTPGNPLYLTIDAELQKLAYHRVSEKGGSAVVIDVLTGDILTMCSTPGFDPNQFAYGISSEYWKSLINSPYGPLTNKAISRQYPPGSTFKIAVALAALRAGVNPQATVFCPGYFTLGRRRFHCWKEGGHGTVNMRSAIQGSCNTYFFTMGQKIGVEAFTKMASELGLGKPTGIPISGELGGVIPDKDWQEHTYKKEWHPGDTLNSAIGQGFVLATPLQLAVMAARLATQRAVTPRLVFDNNALIEGFPKLAIPEAHAAIVMGGMNDVMNKPGGTAYMSRIQEEGMAMMGKTGTSQVVGRAINENKKDHEIEWENRNHALFVGIAPVESPRYAICVVIEHGMGGSKAAAPVAHDIMLEAQKRQSGTTPKLVIGPIYKGSLEKDEEEI